MRIFGIPVTPVGYYMDCVLTTAQIELIATDVGVVDYHPDRETSRGKKKRKRGEFDDTKASAQDIKEASERWIAKYGSGSDAGKGLRIGDILGNFEMPEVGLKLK